MTSKTRKPAAPNFRTELKRRAAAVGVSTTALDRALIIGQVAALLVKDPALKGKIAHKGAAMLQLVEKSERLSADLDSAEIRGNRVDGADVVRALSTEEAKRVVLSVFRNRPGADSASFLLECRGLAGGAAITISLTINWSEPFLLPAVMSDYALPNKTHVTVPVMAAVERAAEKVRAFLSRGEGTDAYDLWWYWTRVLTTADRARLPNLIKKKLAAPSSRVPEGDLHARFDAMAQNAEREWARGTGLVLTGPKPEWVAVQRALTGFKSVVPRALSGR